MTVNRLRVILILTAFVFIAPDLFSRESLSPVPPGMPRGNSGETVVPESLRNLSFIVLGIWPDNGEYYFLPPIKDAKKAASEAEYRALDEQFYRLNFELSHGNILKMIPEYTRVFIAVPENGKVKGASGREEELMRGYLKSRCGWSEERIKKRINFFKAPSDLVWAQDTSEPIGVDKDGKIIIAADPDNYNDSFGVVKAMAKAYPEYFTILKLGNSLSSEGGDMEVVLTPDNKSAMFLTGRNRVNHYFFRTKGYPLKGIAFSQDMIDDVKQAYSDALFGIKTAVVPEEMLLSPELAADEIFHLDMSVVIMSAGKKVDAFVPTYDNPWKKRDLVSGEVFAPSVIKGWQVEYDAIAGELGRMGYNVLRVPFADHPVRSPANLVKYRDPQTGKSCVLLGKYPFLADDNADTAPQAKMNDSFGALNDAEKQWEQSYSTGAYDYLMQCVDNLWAAMDYSASAKNSLYEKQKAIFEKAGYEVTTVAEYPWGAGGIHCDLQF